MRIGERWAIKLYSHTPRMRSSTWDKITAADLSRRLRELGSCHQVCVFQKRERSELGTAIHSYDICHRR